MEKTYVILIGNFILGTAFCVFGQETAYFLNEHLVPIAPIYYLTGLTISGVLLYLIAGLVLLRLSKRQDAISKYLQPFIGLIFIVAFSAAMWSIFVTAMWWG